MSMSPSSVSAIGFESSCAPSLPLSLSGTLASPVAGEPLSAAELVLSAGVSDLPHAVSESAIAAASIIEINFLI